MNKKTSLSKPLQLLCMGSIKVDDDKTTSYVTMPPDVEA
jgi:hypothetical protein